MEKSIEEYLRKGEEALNHGRPKLADNYLIKALRLDPDSLAAHFYLALAKMKLGLLNEAEKHAKIVLMKNPVEPHANLNLGVIRKKRGDSRSAIRLYKKEIKLNPGSLQAYYNLGQMNCDRLRWKVALPYLLKCYRRGYHADQLDQDVARAARKSRNLRVERELYRTELRKNPKDLWALNNLGATYIDTGNLKKARRLLLAALESLSSGRFRGSRSGWRAMIKRNLARTEKAGPR